MKHPNETRRPFQRYAVCGAVAMADGIRVGVVGYAQTRAKVDRIRLGFKRRYKNTVHSTIIRKERRC